MIRIMSPSAVDFDKPPVYTGPIDEGCGPLVEALNAIPGIRTIGCCSGHGDPGREFFVTFTVRDTKALFRVLWAAQSPFVVTMHTYPVREWYSLALPVGLVKPEEFVEGLIEGLNNAVVAESLNTGVGKDGSPRDWRDLNRAVVLNMNIVP
jgi:hypothetical protein